MKTIDTDILVAGAGFAGVMAAIRAAQQGARVAIVSQGDIFSGASFSAGTWGFGLMGPENDADAADFSEQILRVGMGMADPAMVRYLTGHVLGEVEQLRHLGLAFHEPEHKNSQSEFIPCFDRKVRSWFVFWKREVRDALSRQLDALSVQRCPGTELISLCRAGGRVTGAVGICEGRFVRFQAGGVILASGGLAPLFPYHYSADNDTVMGHSLALDAGAELANLEFTQMIPGFVSPCYQALCNERAFRFSRFFDPSTGQPILGPGEGVDWDELLRIRSTHGPFTTRLPSGLIDIRLYEAFCRDRGGVLMRYDPAIRDHPSEFSDHYFRWLREEKGLHFDDEIRIGTFFHASNGGVRIREDGSTGVPGLYACGELTTGMHGADRIGGMSMANGLVFGSAAGRAAARDCEPTGTTGVPCFAPDFILPDAAQAIGRIRALAFQHMMIVREGAGLASMLSALDEEKRQIERERHAFAPDGDMSPEGYLDTARLCSILAVASAAARAMLLRRESRGPHYRSDFPAENAAMAYPITIRRKDGRLLDGLDVR